MLLDQLKDSRFGGRDQHPGRASGRMAALRPRKSGRRSGWVCVRWKFAFALPFAIWPGTTIAVAATAGPVAMVTEPRLGP